MLSRLFPALLFLAATLSAKTSETPPDQLYLGPVDTAQITVDSSADATVLVSAKVLRRNPSAAAIVAKKWYPVFGAAVTMAARKVEVIDSSAAGSVTATDSARYTLVLSGLTITQNTKSVPRRFVPPTPPEYDPTTGIMNPGDRKGHAEGPGRETSLTASAQWILWDNTKRVNGVVSPAARGAASGTSTFRGSTGKSQWDEAARELAKDVLRQTPFTPF